MKKNYFLFLLFLIKFNNIVYGQSTKYVLMGRAYYDGTSQIYKLNVTDDGSGTIYGENVSILPTGKVLIGEVKGKIDYENKLITFRELRIKNLGPDESQSDYYFFNINATFTITNNKTQIIGIFTSKLLTGKTGSNGTIKLIGEKDVLAIHKEYLKKTKSAVVVPKIKRPPVPTKPIAKKIETKLFENNTKPVLIKEPTLVTTSTMIKELPDTQKKIMAIAPKHIYTKDETHFTKDTNVRQEHIVIKQNNEKLKPIKDLPFYEYTNNKMYLEIKDYDKVDGDILSVLINGKVVIEKLELVAETKFIEINMADYGNNTGTDTLVIRADNEGYFSPNSGMVTLVDGTKRMNFTTSANVGEKSYLVLRKKQDK
jgi:hypothetical protein